MQRLELTTQPVTIKDPIARRHGKGCGKPSEWCESSPVKSSSSS